MSEGFWRLKGDVSNHPHVGPWGHGFFWDLGKGSWILLGEWAWNPHDTLPNERCPGLPKRLWQLVEKHCTSCHDLKATSNLKLSKKLKRGVHFEHFLAFWLFDYLWCCRFCWFYFHDCSLNSSCFALQDRSKTTLHSSHSSASTVRHNKPTKGYHPVWISSWNISKIFGIPNWQWWYSGLIQFYWRVTTRMSISNVCCTSGTDS